jgi:hypothetical protein
MTLPKGVSRDALDRETAVFKRKIHKAILDGITRNGTQALGSISSVQMSALIYVLIDELILAAAAANLMGSNEGMGTTMGTSLVETFGQAVREGIRVRTLQLRHAVDEMAERTDGHDRS